MGSTTRILYIGGGKEILETLEKARSLGLEIVYIQHKDYFREAVLKYVDQVVLIDYHNIDILVPTARMLQTLFPFTGVISLSEDALVPTAHVCEALGLPGNSLETVRLLKDKWLMRQRLNALGISPVTAQVGQTMEDMISFAREHGLPMIVKPVDATGSIGVFRIGHLEEVADVWQQVQQLGLPRFLMEEYLDGREISVESFSFHGRHVILAVTDKLTLPNHVEIGHSIPAQIEQATHDSVVQLVKTFLDAVGLQEGPAHTEIKLTSKGPRIVESHNRPGGDRINEMVRVACGFDMKKMALAWLCGLVEPLETSPPIQAGTAIRFFTPAPGTVREISGLDEALRSEGVVELQVYTKVGDRVRPVKESRDRSGHVLTMGADVQEAISRCEEIVRKVQILTTADP